MAITNTSKAPDTLKTYEAKVTAQVQAAKAKLEQFQAQVKGKSTHEDAGVVSSLQSAKQNIDRKLQDLKKTTDSNLTRAKADIDADVAKFTSSIDELGTRLKKLVK
jgi:hypothetical protein